MTNDKYRKYRQHFTQSEFKQKLSKIGGAVRVKAMLLYLVFRDPLTPVWVKVLIISVLGYLICPLDGIPDAIPIIGYTDDLAAMIALLVSIEGYITPETRKKARK